MEEQGYTCERCGKCCHYEIPLTILDIHRIADGLDIADRIAFHLIIQNDISSKSLLFKIRKKRDGACVFLDNNDECSIHDSRPRVCEFYFCELSDKEEMTSWTGEYVQTGDKSKLWEQSIAIQVTGAYIDEHGAEFYSEDYNDALDSILKNVKTEQRDKIRLGRIPGGNACGIIYNCSKCDHSKGKMAEETLVTLSDIKRIKEAKDITYEKLFENFISDEISEDGYLMLRRDGSCIFFDEEDHCSIEDFRPMHCRFPPCPEEVDEEIKNCLYLGSGTIEEQFKHQISLGVTKEYVNDIGTRYDKEGFLKYLDKIDKIIKDESNLEEFCDKISPYRYVDDTKKILDS